MVVLMQDCETVNVIICSFHMVAFVVGYLACLHPANALDHPTISTQPRKGFRPPEPF